MDLEQLISLSSSDELFYYILTNAMKKKSPNFLIYCINSITLRFPAHIYDVADPL